MDGEKKIRPNEGHILTRFGNMAALLARFLQFEFRVFGARYETIRRTAQALGLARREDFSLLSEEIDRLEGLAERLMKKRPDSGKGEKKTGSKKSAR